MSFSKELRSMYKKGGFKSIANLTLQPLIEDFLYENKLSLKRYKDAVTLVEDYLIAQVCKHEEVFKKNPTFPILNNIFLKVKNEFSEQAFVDWIYKNSVTNEGIEEE